MKEVINLQGKKELVPNNTAVKTVNGVHYLLTPEDQAEIDSREAEWTVKQDDYLANEKYKDDRKKAYGTIEDQLDMIYWDQVNGTSKWKDHIDTIKSQYPKPE